LFRTGPALLQGGGLKEAEKQGITSVYSLDFPGFPEEPILIGFSEKATKTGI
jgi:hypothetical protein